MYESSAGMKEKVTIVDKWPLKRGRGGGRLWRFDCTTRVY